MKIKIIIVFLISFCANVFAQSGFQFENNKNKIVIPFKLINNLIFIPITVNGIELNFMLDSGSGETILFSLEDQEQISFSNAKKIKLKGFGTDDFIDGLKSTNNKLSVHGFSDSNHELYIVLDQEFNLSSQIGIPVNGIIGYKFFENYLVETNYSKKKIFIYKNDIKIRKKLDEKYSNSPILIENSKPYFQTKITIDNKIIETKMLLDSGNSDALWIFLNQNNQLKVPKNNFDDYLGRGFSGQIFGKRARIDKLSITNFDFDKPLAAFLDTISIKKSNIIQDREGSIGAEILKRFNIVYDYPKSKIYFKKNELYNLPFNFNMSGIEIQHDGLQWVKEKEEISKNGTIAFSLSEEKIINFNYKFSLKPTFKITSIRANSPAEQIGLKKEDQIITINNHQIYNYTLQEINELLKSEEGKSITIEIERDNKIYNFKFQLKNIL
jgi:hypothetical protein